MKFQELLNRCLHCGMCLPVCPTYALTMDETSSPRGRIRLIHSVTSRTMEMSRAYVDEMYFCLDCQACQTACPAGVEYGKLVEAARQTISARHREPLGLRLFKAVFLRGVLGTRKRILATARLLRAYERSGVREAVERSGILRVFSERLDQKHKLLPRMSPAVFDLSQPEILPARRGARGRVAFLSGCIMNVAFAEIHQDAVDVLQENGFEVTIPRGQGCCGSLHAHNGDMASARTLARKIIEIFSQATFDTLVVDSAGCAAFIKEYGALFAGEPDLAEKAAALSRKTKEITEFLADSGVRPPKKPLHATVTYHEACHLVHAQQISRQPRELLGCIPGLELVELPEATWCCGSAGVFNILRYEDSMRLLDRKMSNFEDTGAEILVAANPGCQLQLEYGARQRALRVEILHPVSLLRRAYRRDGEDAE